jgi:hypothetical protein
MIVLQQVVQVWQALGQHMLDFALGALQHKPIVVGKDLRKTLTNTAAAMIHESVHHMQDL